MNEDAIELADTDMPVEIEDAGTKEEESNDVPQMPEQFAVRDAASASWVVRRINEARAYRRRVSAWAEREIKRSENDENFLLRRFGQELEAWAATAISRLKGRRRSIGLPGGTVGFRRRQATLVIDDADAVLRWARRCCPAAVVTTERLTKTPIYEHLEQTGELPDQGAHIEPEADRFYIQ